MIHKPRQIPLIVHFCQALIPRLIPSHPKIQVIERDIRKFMSGYRGEVTTDYYMQFLDDKNHFIYRGLRLPHEKNFFQVDTLILTRKSILLLETKNLPGEVYINKEQFSQVSNYGEKGYSNPIIQVERHKEKLQDWLASHHLPKIPSLTLVVLSNSSSVIKSTEPDILNKVCKGDNIKGKILNLTNGYTKEILSIKEIRKISKRLLEDDTPLFPDIKKNYDINPSDLIHGIRCSRCSRYRMVRKDRLWICPHCFHDSKTAYYDTLLDYFLLVKPTITNREFREFLGIDSVKTANYFISSLNLPSTGLNKGRVYHRPIDFLTQLENRYDKQNKKLEHK